MYKNKIKKSFTLKTWIFGLVCLLIVCFFPHFSSKYLLLNDAISGYLPALPLFLIIILSFLWNLITSKISKKLTLSSKELAVVFCFMIFISWIPHIESSLVRHLILPRYTELTSNATWKEAGLTSRLPKELFPQGQDGSAIGEKVHFSFIQGKNDNKSKLSLDDIPYKAWVGPMLQWIPIIMLFSICLLGLTYIIHRQWSYHEQLRYPLASVVDSLIAQNKDGSGGTIYRNKIFIAGFVFVFVLQLIMFMNSCFPTQFPRIPYGYQLPWQTIFPILGKSQSNARIFDLNWMQLSFAIIGIAFLVPSDVSLSVGLTAPLGSLLAVNYFLTTGDPVSSSDLGILRSGGFIAFGIILLYTGRSYYFPLFLKAFVPNRKISDEIDKSQVWAARIFIIAYISLVLVFIQIGFDLIVSFVYVSFLLLIFLVITRLVCETGIPMITPNWSLPSLMTGLFGPAAIGALPLIFITLLSTTIAGSNPLPMPYMATGLRILDDNKVNLKRFALVSQFVILLALIVCIFMTLGISYIKGEGKLSYGETLHINKGVYQVLNMKDTGELDLAENSSTFEKFNLLRSDGKTVGIVITGIIAVLALYLLRFRFAKWQLHPIFIIILGSTIQGTWFCFLIGWFIKNTVVKLGGGKSYNHLKPLFIGLIVGEFAGVILRIISGLIYFLITGNPLKVFR